MKYLLRGQLAVGALALAALPSLILAPAASAEPVPADPNSGDQAPPAAQAEPVITLPAPMAPETGDAIAAACRQFGSAIDLAASYYEEFAYASAGSGNLVNYQDPNISQYNVLGRTALRSAAGSALDAAATPGLPGDIAAPMRAWSMHATKLLLIMGLRGGGDSLNSAAEDLNTDANNAQMACAMNGFQR